MRMFRDPETVHPPVAAYAHQIEVSDPKRWLVMSGQIGMRVDGDLPDDPIEQLQIALDNISRNLEAAGMGVDDIVKLTTCGRSRHHSSPRGDGCVAGRARTLLDPPLCGRAGSTDHQS